MWMRCIARMTLAVTMALVCASCGGSDAPGHADSALPAAAATVNDGVDSLFAGEPAVADVSSGDETGGAAGELPEVRMADGDVAAPATPPRTAPVDRAGAPALDVAPPAASMAPDSVPIMPPTAVPPGSGAMRRTSGAPAAAGAAPGPPAAGGDVLHRPFEVGERLTYEVRFGPLAVGIATMQVLDITTVRGIRAYHTRFEVRGGNRLYRVHDRYESWFDTRTLASLRYMQDINEGNYERTSTFEIYPDERRYVEQGKEAQPSVEHPLDEGSFIYWMRTIPLEVGQTYSFDRYFRPDRNPVRIEVLRRERVRVPAGTFDAIVVRPMIKTKGIFSEGGRAEIWFADDSTRRIIQMKSKLSFGSLNLYLK